MDKKYDIYRILSYSIILAAFSYLCLRAYYIAVFHDEALTLIRHAVLPVRDILAFRGGVPANNHLLNTLLVKLSVRLFGLHEFTVRLPALLGAALYLAGSYKILGLFLDRWRLAAGLLIMICNPFLLEILSAGRGYALGLGFFVLGVYFILAGRDRGSLGGVLSVAMMTGAVLSHLTFLNVYLTAIVILALLEAADIYTDGLEGEGLLGRLKARFRGSLLRAAALPMAVLSSAVFLTAIYYKPAVFMMTRQGIPFGILRLTHGFWQDTVASLVEYSLYGQRFGFDAARAVKAVVVGTVLLGVWVLVWEGLRTVRVLVRDKLLWILLMPLVCTVGIVLQHRLLNVPYAHERYAIFYVPMFSLLLSSVLFRPLAAGYIRKALSALGCLFALILLFHTLRTANLLYSFVYKEDTYTREVMTEIAEETSHLKSRPGAVRLGISPTYEPGINFYILKDRLEWIGFVDRRGPFGVYDYYYVLDEDYEKMAPMIKVIRKYDISRTYDSPQYSYFGVFKAEASERTVGLP